MNRFKWFFMSKYKKLLYAIKCAKSNEQRLHLENGIVLDFSIPETQVHVYKVMLKDPTDDDPFYMVDAPNEYIAKWCGANLYNNEFIAFKSAKDMEVEEFKLGGGTTMKRPRNRTLPLTFEPYAKVVWLNYPDNIINPHCLEYSGTHWENLLYDFFRNNEEIYEKIHQLDTDLGMTAGAIEIYFKYDTPDDVIKDICDRAIQMMQVATTPIFKVGQSALFKTTQSDLVQYNDREVIVKRLLTEDECDIDEVGFMYEVETNDEIFQAYQDELS